MGPRLKGVTPPECPQVPSLRRDPGTPSPRSPQLKDTAPSHSPSSHTSLLPPPPSNPLDSGLFPDPGRCLSQRAPPHARPHFSLAGLPPPLGGRKVPSRPRPPPSTSPPSTADPPAPGSSSPSSYFPMPLTRFWTLDLVPKSLSPKVSPSPVSPKHPRGPPPRPPTWRRVVQLAVIGPPAGASRLPNKERARHGGRSNRGRRVARSGRKFLHTRGRAAAL